LKTPEYSTRQQGKGRFSKKKRKKKIHARRRKVWKKKKKMQKSLLITHSENRADASTGEPKHVSTKARVGKKGGEKYKKKLPTP